MKTKLIAICIVLIGSHTVDAQSQQPRAIIGLGLSLSNIMDVKYDPYPSSLVDWSQYPFNDAFHLLGSNWNIKRSPTVALHSDWRLDNRFAFGVGVSYDQGTFAYKLDAYEPTTVYIMGFAWHTSKQLTVLHYRLDFRRLNVGCRGLYYMISNENFEVYTGLRCGLTRYNFNRQLFVLREGAEGKHRLPPSGEENRIQLQLILLGWNVNLGKRFLLQFEVAVGQPYSLAMNLGYRL